MSPSPDDLLRYLVSSDSLAVCPLLDASSFSSYCKKRGIDVDAARLERLDRIGVFRPLLRLRRPLVTFKVEERNGTKVLAGMVDAEEGWDGETEEDHASIQFDPETAGWFLSNGHIWSPATRGFVPWDKAVGRHHRPVEAAYYSRFQIEHLRWALQGFNLNVVIDGFVDADEAGFSRLAEQIQKMRDSVLKTVDVRRGNEAEAVLLQAISTRYYPLTQTDRRSFRISTPIRYPEFDWQTAVGSWRAEEALSKTGFSVEAVRDLHERCSLLAHGLDPLASWYDLVSFIDPSKRDDLKGEALYAQDLYAIEHMLRLFYKDLTDETLFPPDESPQWRKEQFYGKGVPDDPLRLLEFVANRFHVNPRPRLLLIVEGDGEIQQVPRLLDVVLGAPAGVVGIEIRSLGGVSGFTGKKSIDRYGALEKLIDAYHANQVVVFVILDNDQRVAQVRDRLLQAESKFSPGRKVTKDDYIMIWDTCFEFDNFSHDEIAAALSRLAEGRYGFTPAEMASCEASFRAKKGDPLSALYHEKLAYSLDKPKLMEELVAPLLANPEGERTGPSSWKRPILTALAKAVEVAVSNYPPVTQETAEENQRSGFLG